MLLIYNYGCAASTIYCSLMFEYSKLSILSSTEVITEVADNVKWSMSFTFFSVILQSLTHGTCITCEQYECAEYELLEQHKCSPAIFRHRPTHHTFTGIETNKRLSAKTVTTRRPSAECITPSNHLYLLNIKNLNKLDGTRRAPPDVTLTYDLLS